MKYVVGERVKQKSTSKERELERLRKSGEGEKEENGRGCMKRQNRAKRGREEKVKKTTT